jgi:hypothetical protein
MKQTKPIAVLTVVILFLSSCGGGGGVGTVKEPINGLSGSWFSNSGFSKTITYPDGYTEHIGYQESGLWGFYDISGNSIYDKSSEEDGLDYTIDYSYDGTTLIIIETVPSQTVNWIPAFIEEGNFPDKTDESCTFSGSFSLTITFINDTSGEVKTGTNNCQYITSIGSYSVSTKIYSGTFTKQN